MPHAETPMEAVLRTGESAPDLEVIIEQPNGLRVVVLVNITPLFNESGKQIGAVNCFQDLSAQKQSEKDRESLREELRQSQKLEAMGQLVGGRRTRLQQSADANHGQSGPASGQYNLPIAPRPLSNVS